MRDRVRTGKDANKIAASVVAAATSNKPRRKDPHAVALGRRGGQKGGHARAASLTAAERSEAARKAARARWAKQK